MSKYGSSNYILTKLFQEGKSYGEALREAQANGFAEADPALDAGGFDAKFKLSIILQHAFGIRHHPDRIFNCSRSKVEMICNNYSQ